MQFGIIACGEGSRLHKEGLAEVKPLVKIAGKPLLGRLIEIFFDSCASSIDIIVNESMPEVAEYISGLKQKIEIPINLWPDSTPSSFHSFHNLMRHMKPSDKFVITTVDTVFNENAFKRYIRYFDGEVPGADALMGVTSYVDDEKPLFVSVDHEGNVIGFHDSCEKGCQFVSAGVYGFNPTVIPLIEDCYDSGVSRMRNFQRRLIKNNCDVKYFDLGKVFDIDHIEDIRKAEKFLSGDSESLINDI